MLQARLEGWRRLGRPFRLLLASDALMLLSMMVGHVAVPWWIAHEGGASHLALYAALLAGVSFFALPLLSPLGDRVSRRVLVTTAGGTASALWVNAALLLLACGTATRMVAPAWPPNGRSPPNAAGPSFPSW